MVFLTLPEASTRRQPLHLSGEEEQRLSRGWLNGWHCSTWMRTSLPLLHGRRTWGLWCWKRSWRTSQTCAWRCRSSDWRARDWNSMAWRPLICCSTEPTMLSQRMLACVRAKRRMMLGMQLQHPVCKPAFARHRTCSWQARGRPRLCSRKPSPHEARQRKPKHHLAVGRVHPKAAMLRHCHRKAMMLRCMPAKRQDLLQGMRAMRKPSRRDASGSGCLQQQAAMTASSRGKGDRWTPTQH
mmetsp:Transcript_8464/g.19907  ORF Transcript_8464/g.19907 Transcript_8464/m.19907 type:complete len:240 (+) Transcript_8464:70-789(+)